MEPIPRRAKPVAQRSGRWLLAGRASAKLLSCFGCPLLAPPQNNVPPTRYPARRVAGGKRAARESGKIVDGGGSPAGQARGLRRAWLTRGVGMHLLFFEQAPGSWRLHMRKETPPGEDGRGRAGSSRCLSRRVLSGVGLLQLTRATLVDCRVAPQATAPWISGRQSSRMSTKASGASFRRVLR